MSGRGDFKRKERQATGKKRGGGEVPSTERVPERGRKIPGEASRREAEVT